MHKKVRLGKSTAIILTGGYGIRVRSSRVPKQFIELKGKPLFIWCIETYDKINEIDEIILVINREFEQLYLKILKKNRFRKLTKIVYGGKYRQNSIKNALKRVKHTGFVVIQNGVSPFTSARLIKRCLKIAMKRKIVSAFIPAQNTFFVKKGGRIKKVLERKNVGFTCDPQVYKVSIVRKILQLSESKKNKDLPIVDLLRKNGKSIFLVKSCTNNLKVTTEMDTRILNYLFKQERKSKAAHL